jgi:hypothetical protein
MNDDIKKYRALRDVLEKQGFEESDVQLFKLDMNIVTIFVDILDNGKILISVNLEDNHLFNGFEVLSKETNIDKINKTNLLNLIKTCRVFDEKYKNIGKDIGKIEY